MTSFILLYQIVFVLMFIEVEGEVLEQDKSVPVPPPL